MLMRPLPCQEAGNRFIANCVLYMGQCLARSLLGPDMGSRLGIIHAGLSVVKDGAATFSAVWCFPVLLTCEVVLPAGDAFLWPFTPHPARARLPSCKVLSKEHQPQRQGKEEKMVKPTILDILVSGRTESVQQNQFGRLQPIWTCVSHGSIAVPMLLWGSFSKCNNNTGPSQVFPVLRYSALSRSR